MAVWSHSTWQRLEGVTNRNISYLQWLDPAVWHLRERKENVWMSQSRKPFSCFGFHATCVGSEFQQWAEAAWLLEQNTCVLYVEQEVSSLTYWFTSMFLSNTPRTISTGLVFWDWEGLLRWCRDMDWGKGRCKVISLNTSFHIWDGNRHLMGFVNRLVKSMVLRKSKSLLGKFIHQDRV